MNSLYEETCFGIIAAAGACRSDFIEAIQSAKDGDFEHAEECLNSGNEKLQQAKTVHFSMIQKEAAGEYEDKVGILMIHAEDMMMSGEDLGIIAEETVDAFKRFVYKTEQ